MEMSFLLNEMRPQLLGTQYLHEEYHTEQNRSTLHAESSALLVLRKDLTRV